MTINGIGFSNPMIQHLVDTRATLDDLQRQLGTGKKADSYRGLDRDAGLDITFRQRLSVLQGYQDTITRVQIRLDIVDTVLNQVDNQVSEAMGSIDPNAFNLLGTDKTIAQKGAEVALGEILSALNTEADGRYVFSGTDVEKEPLESVNTILDGTATHAGFRQVLSERKQADLGAGGLGRLGVSTVTDTVTLAEDGSHPFGFKIAGIQNNLSSVTVTSTAGPPASEDIQFTSLPSPGQDLTVTLTLPDGSTDTVTLTASSQSGVAGTFQIGATANATAANFDAALQTALAEKASTSLAAASAVQAGVDFFTTANGQVPQRVDGPPFDTATALRSGAPDTVAFYAGENNATDARATSTAKVDASLSLDYGARANEEPLAQAIRSLAVFAVETFDDTVTGDDIRYRELATRIRQDLAFSDGSKSVENLHVEIVSVAEAVESARLRHVSAEGILTTSIDEIEGADMEEVAAKILTLQTRLQASYQTTAILNQLSLVNYI